jgi:hypothetical protein
LKVICNFVKDFELLNEKMIFISKTIAEGNLILLEMALDRMNEFMAEIKIEESCFKQNNIHPNAKFYYSDEEEEKNILELKTLEYQFSKLSDIKLTLNISTFFNN